MVPYLKDLKGKGLEARHQLFRILQKAWDELDGEVLLGLAGSMKSRCQAVIDAEGWHRKY